MKHNNLSMWIRSKNLFISGNEDSEKITHLCLDGGKFGIPQNLHGEFMDIYKKGMLNRNEKYYVCEVPTEVCRMYVDMDFIDNKVMNTAIIVKYTKAIQEVIEEYYGNFDILVCKNKSTEITKNKTKYTKTGVHLIWPELYVKQPNALKLSKLFVNKLKNIFGERHIENIWSDVIDSSVYNRKVPSLRMVGSRKISRNMKGEFVDSGRKYLPSVLFKKDGSQIKIGKNVKEIRPYLETCFLRVFEAETPWVKEIENCIGEIKTPSTNKKIHELKNNDSLVVEIENFINGLGVTGWDECSVRSVVKDKKFYTIKVDDTMYCMNKEDDHNSCGIYFVISEKGLKQRCFCRCDTTEGRVDGKCSDYSSKNFKIPPLLYSKLFGYTKQDMTKKRFSVDNCFPPFDLLEKHPIKYGSMLKNTIMFYDRKKDS